MQPPRTRRPAAPPDPMDTFRNWLLAITAAVLLGVALKFMRPVLVPVTLALFITLIVAPVERRIAELVPRHMRWPGLLAAMATILSVFAVFIGVLYVGMRRIAGALRGVPARIDEMIREARLDEQSMFGADIEQLVSLIGDRGVSFASMLVSRSVNQASTTILTLALTVFLVMLMLNEAPRAARKLETVSDDEDTSRWRSAIRQIARKLRLYLLARAALGMLTALCYAAWLWVCDVELILVWAMLTFLFGFVPNLGSVVSSALPVLYVLATGETDNIWLLIIGLLVIEQVIGNFIDPHVQGSQVSLAPVVILMSVIFWGWLWGALGALLGVPIMIAVTVAAANMGPSRGVALFLSDQSDFEGLDRVCLEPRADAPEDKARA